MRLRPLVFSAFAFSLSGLAAAACGGTVVFEEDGSSANGSGGDGGAAVGSAATGRPNGTSAGPVTSSSSGDGGTVDVASPASVGPGGGVDVTTVGPSGPGPSGVGGADVGPAGPVGVSSSGGCTASMEQTLEYCYVIERCQSRQLEVECEVAGQGPYTCWCYQDGQFSGQCTEVDASCSVFGCCEGLWVFPE